MNRAKYRVGNHHFAHNSIKASIVAMLLPESWQNGDMARVAFSEDVTNIYCRTAHEFLEVLDPLAGLFQHRTPAGTYLFRGISSSKHHLIPSAFRRGADLLFRGTFVTAPLALASDQCVAELNTIQRFFEIAARHGLRLPEDSQTLRHELDEWVRKLNYKISTAFEVYTWPPPEFYSLIALAQHYLVPTRALDWTWNPLVAAYFAARTARPTSDDNIVVWVFNDTTRQVDVIVSDNASQPRTLVVFSAPGAENDNLRAQRGAFMLFQQSIAMPIAKFKATPYDSLLRDSYPTARGATALFRVFLPSSESRKVLALLSVAGITAGALFPGLWGVARELEEQLLLDDHYGRLSQQPKMSALASRIVKRHVGKRNRGA